MASDHYSPVHNLILRGQVIPTRFVGVWGYITSHTEGWKIFEKKIQEDLGVGREFVRNALKAFEDAHCLIREQSRNSGMFGKAEPWFVTDLPLQLRQLGIFDEETIRTRVHEAFHAWKQAHSKPVPTSGDSDHVEGASVGEAEKDGHEDQTPRSRPMTGNPSTVGSTVDGFAVDGETDDGESAPKKNKTQEDQPGKKKTSSSSSPPPPDTTDSSREAEEEGPNEPSPRSDQADDPMPDLLARFWEALPNEITPNAHARKPVTAQIRGLFSAPNTWSDHPDGPELLAAWFEWRRPDTAIRTAPGWLISQCQFAPSGPLGDEDFVPHDECPNACDESYMIPDGEMVRRCSYQHRRKTGSDLSDDKLREMILGSLEQAAQQEPQVDMRAPAGSRTPFGEEVPPF